VKKIFLLPALLILFFVQNAAAQNDSSHLRISILTCGQGEELYTIFGHTAIRITDSIKQTDIVYNYGNFDYNDPDFYTKFVRGKLDYSLAIEGLPDFMYEYQVEKRSVSEQELLLSGAQKLSIQKALAENLAGAARYYKYDFTLDNCTTRVRDMLGRHAGFVVTKELVPAKTSFRDMIHEYLERGNAPWTKLGVDLLMGVSTDKKVNINESMFLPDYLAKGIDSSANEVMKEKIFLNSGNNTTTLYHNWPLYVFSICAFIAAALSFAKNKAAKSFTRFFDVFLFLVTGIMGWLFVFLWFGTDHSQFAGNYNLLWALPTNLIAVIFIRKSPGWLQKYFTIVSIIYVLTLVLWLWLPQRLNIALVPVILLLLFRSLQLRKK
jgi:hypothetical protein